MTQDVYKAGLDMGSTTAKIVLLDQAGIPVFSRYQRHHAKLHQTVRIALHEILDQKGDVLLDLALTGSAALGASERLDLPFVQEVVATGEVVRKCYPDVRTAMDIGGEDSKIIFFEKDRPPDIRMNGSCAGGTGSFIDQMASLMDVPPNRLDSLARDHSHIYPVASRCGVFAKTDVQNMLSRNIPHPDIAASIFHAVAIQCINSLARGVEIRPGILLCGGVFAFLPELVNQFLSVLGFSKKEMILPENSELIPALGAALFDRFDRPPIRVSHLIRRLDLSSVSDDPLENRMAPLFDSPAHFREWEEQSGCIDLETCDLEAYTGRACFLGVDSGSTTTKIAVIGENRECLFSWYVNNAGNPVRAVIDGLVAFRAERDRKNPDLKIVRSVVTGYGEDLIRAAFNMDKGIVETIAHYTAARFIEPEVSFILDIGGQDMKAIFVDQGVVSRLELNEACSSGCGSFLETLADALDLDIETFSRLACDAKAPCDLGTRCTVFMNSKIKQSLRENASVADISAGLSYSVIKNCLFKVLKLHSMSEMGDHIVLQGGTFRNPSIVRALEKLTGRTVKLSSRPELMGALGAALTALSDHVSAPEVGTKLHRLESVERVADYKTRQIACKGCENTCRVTEFVFPNQQSFYSGNNCERYFGARGETHHTGFDFVEFKNDLLFNRPEPSSTASDHTNITIGIPRCLNFYENFVFWQTLFDQCGIRVVLSSPSTVQMSEKGMGTVMSDNICFPAKLAHGHVIDLLEKGVDRIFYPLVIYEKDEFENALNTYNCPIVSGYADVIESAIDPEGKWQIPLDRLVISFKDESLLKKACLTYLKKFNIGRKKGRNAFEKALSAQADFKREIRGKAAELIERAERDHSLLIVLAGRPYHSDALINHKIPRILTGLGADIVTEDALPSDGRSLEGVQVVTQWSYPNRIYAAARWVADRSVNFQMVQLNSFGCGPDAVVIDETKEILLSGHKNHTLIKVDEISSPGSVRLRLRSMVESLGMQTSWKKIVPALRPPFVRFRGEDKRRIILAPFFAEDYSGYLPGIFKNAGYTLKVLPRPDRASVDLGLQYASNDICYPGTIVIGDIIKALKKGDYSLDDVAIGITQTGGQCRASNYLSLIRKAMIRAGYAEVPIISVAASQGLVDQPGFHINWLKKTRILFVAAMFADCIAKMYYATGVRETIAGSSRALREKMIKEGGDRIAANDLAGIFRLLDKAIDAFNRIPVHDRNLPKMGLVGEIYAKYNYFSNQNLAHWLMTQNIEPVFPPIVDYFIQDLVNYKENIKAGIRNRKLTDLLGYPIEWLIRYYHGKMSRQLSRFRHCLPFEDIKTIAQKASGILTMTNQFGEGWLVPGEIAEFAEKGIRHVISLQPFGCIANHIISKGVEKRIKALYPGMNLYYLDFDAGMSEANVRNRLHFMIENL